MGCGVLVHKQPTLSAFKYHGLFTSTDTNLVKMNQIYAFSNTDKIKEGVAAFSDDAAAEDIFYFLPDGGIFSYNTNLPSNWSDIQQRQFLKNWKYGMGERGFYYSPDGKNLKIEILDGFSTYGYFFIYYDCQIVSKDSILIKKVGYKPYQKHYGHSYENAARDGRASDYNLFKFKPLK